MTEKPRLHMLFTALHHVTFRRTCCKLRQACFSIASVRMAQISQALTVGSLILHCLHVCCKHYTRFMEQHTQTADCHCWDAWTLAKSKYHTGPGNCRPALSVMAVWTYSVSLQPPWCPACIRTCYAWASQHDTAWDGFDPGQAACCWQVVAEACMLHDADNEVQKHACCMTAGTLLLCQTHIRSLLICKCLAYVATSQCRLLQWQ